MATLLSYAWLEDCAAAVAGKIRAHFAPDGDTDSGQAALRCHAATAGAAAACLLVMRHAPLRLVESADQAQLELTDFDSNDPPAPAESLPRFSLAAWRPQSDTAGRALIMADGSITLIGPDTAAAEKCTGLLLDRGETVIFPWEQANARTALTIGARIRASGASFGAADNIADFIREGELDLLEREVAGHAEQMLRSLVIDTATDPNSRRTAARIARLYLREAFQGRYQPPPAVSRYPVKRGAQGLCALGPVALHSTCAHHFVPVTGQLWMGFIPDGHVIGLSKFSRAAGWLMNRPHIQEDAVIMLADYLEELIRPRGLVIALRASHLCMTWRGVREDKGLGTVSLVTRGDFRETPDLVSQFLQLVRTQEPCGAS